MNKFLTYILPLTLLAACSESTFNDAYKPALCKRTLTTSSNTVTMPSSASTGIFYVYAENAPWQLTIPSSWVKADITSGDGNTAVKLSTENNNSTDITRVCVAQLTSTVADWSKCIDITLCQEKTIPYISSKTYIYNVSGKSQELDIALNSNVTYDVSSDAWIHVVSTSSSNLKLQIDENTSDIPRTGYVTIQSKSQPQITQKFTINQKRAYISSTTSKVNVGCNEEAVAITVESEGAWTSTAPSWISVSPSAGSTGITPVILSISKNSTEGERNASVNFTLLSGKCVEIPVCQAAMLLNVTEQSLSFSSNSGSLSFTVTSNTDWQISSKPEWLTVSTSTGSGNTHTVKANAQENNSTNVRSGKIIVATTDGALQREIKVTQSAKSVDYSDVSLEFPHAGGSHSFSFSTDGSWTAQCSADWFSVDKTSGSNSATITVTASENLSTEDRNGEVTLNIAGKTYIATVHQASKYVTLSSDAFNFGSAQSNINVTISSNTSWTATVKGAPEWLKCTPSSGTGNAQLTISADENNTADNRTATIEVEIPNVKTYLINVTQLGKTLNVAPTSVSFSKISGTADITVTSDAPFVVSRFGSWFSHYVTDNVIHVAATTNNTGVPRSGYLTITLTGLSSGSKSVTVPTTQTAGNTNAVRESEIIVELKE